MVELQEDALAAPQGRPVGPFENGTPGDDTIGGTEGDDSLSGGAGDDFVQGRRGDDELNGLDGDDLLFGDQDDDSLSGGAGSDILDGFLGDDSLFGGADDDSLLGGAGVNTLNGGPGEDFIITRLNSADTVVDGGSGFDLFRLDSRGIAPEFRPAVTMTGDPATSASLFAGGKLLAELSGVESIRIDGGGGDDSLLGGVGGDRIRFIGQGVDTVSTGDGDDRVTLGLFKGKTDLVDLGDGVDSCWIEVRDTRDVVMTREDDGVHIRSGANESAIVVSAERFKITSGSGDDNLLGGRSNDTFDLERQGGDTARGGAGDDDFTVALDEKADVLVGGQGFDAMTILNNFFTGVDGPLVMQSTDRSLSITFGGQTILEARSVEQVFLRGSLGDDLISGLAGDDTLFGEEGDDTLSGGDGDDLIESQGDNNLSERNVVDGGAGTDSLSLDRFTFPERDADYRVELVAGETVTVFRDGEASDRLTSIENLIGSSGNDTLISDDGANVIDGGSGDDELDGGDGVDTVDYSGTTIEVSLKRGVASVGGDVDVLENFENVICGDGRDTIGGDRGANALEGGFEDDTITGGGGADTFVYRDNSDSERESSFDERRGDFIRDFDADEGDTIDLSSIDAVGRLGRTSIEASGANESFDFIGEAAFSGEAGELRFSSGDTTFIRGDLDGDKVADLTIRLSGQITLTADDFIL